MRATILLFALVIGPALGGEARWIRMESPNFEMYSTAGERSTRDTLQYFEQVRSFFAQNIPPAREKPLPVRIVAFSSMPMDKTHRLASQRPRANRTSRITFAAVVDFDLQARSSRAIVGV